MERCRLIGSVLGVLGRFRRMAHPLSLLQRLWNPMLAQTAVDDERPASRETYLSSESRLMRRKDHVRDALGNLGVYARLLAGRASICLAIGRTAGCCRWLHRD